MIKNSHIVIFHESSAALDAVLLKKNIINLQSKLLEATYQKDLHYIPTNWEFLLTI